MSWLLAALLLAGPSTTAFAGELPTAGHVVKVYDGDTFTLATGDKIRLRLINTPELKPAEPYGIEARDLATRWLLDHDVTLQLGPEGRDGYGRILAGVSTEEGPVAIALLTAGLGHLFVIPPDDTDLTPYLAAQAEARAARRGIWSMDAFQAGLHVTSFHANGAGDDLRDPTTEYFRLCNVAGEPVQLSAWKVRNRAGQEVALPELLLPPGYAVRVASGKGVPATNPKSALTVYLGTDGPFWDDDFDVLSLIGPDGRTTEERPSKAH